MESLELKLKKINLGCSFFIDDLPKVIKRGVKIIGILFDPVVFIVKKANRLR